MPDDKPTGGYKENIKDPCSGQYPFVDDTQNSVHETKKGKEQKDRTENTKNNEGDKRVIMLESNKKWWSDWQFYSMLANLVMAFVAFVALQTSNETLTETKLSMAQDSIKDIKILKLMQSTDSANWENIKMSKQNFIIENRPYLEVKDFNWTPFAKNSKFVMEANLINKGKSAALNINNIGQMDMSDSPYGISIKLRRKSVQMGDIQPTGHTIIMESWPPIDQTSYDAIKYRTPYLYFSGQISYSDIFGGNYVTRYSVVYQVNDPSTWLYNTTFNNVK